MTKLRWVWAMLALWLLAGCGPDTIFVRPGLDTPEQHVNNGHQLLRRGKLDDAYREFNRAMELDPKFVRAHVGLGVILGRKGDIEASMQAMKRADQLSVTQRDRDAVQYGYRQICEIKCRNVGAPKAP